MDESDVARGMENKVTTIMMPMPCKGVMGVKLQTGVTNQPQNLDKTKPLTKTFTTANAVVVRNKAKVTIEIPLGR